MPKHLLLKLLSLQLARLLLLKLLSLQLARP